MMSQTGVIKVINIMTDNNDDGQVIMTGRLNGRHRLVVVKSKATPLATCAYDVYEDNYSLHVNSSNTGLKKNYIK